MSANGIYFGGEFHRYQLRQLIPDVCTRDPSGAERNFELCKNEETFRDLFWLDRRLNNFVTELLKTHLQQKELCDSFTELRIKLDLRAAEYLRFTNDVHRLKEIYTDVEKMLEDAFGIRTWGPKQGQLSLIDVGQMRKPEQTCSDLFLQLFGINNEETKLHEEILSLMPPVNDKIQRVLLAKKSL